MWKPGQDEEREGKVSFHSSPACLVKIRIGRWMFPGLGRWSLLKDRRVRCKKGRRCKWDGRAIAACAGGEPEDLKQMCLEVIEHAYSFA